MLFTISTTIVYPSNVKAWHQPQYHQQAAMLQGRVIMLCTYHVTCHVVYIPCWQWMVRVGLAMFSTWLFSHMLRAQDLQPARMHTDTNRVAALPSALY